MKRNQGLQVRRREVLAAGAGVSFTHLAFGQAAAKPTTPLADFFRVPAISGLRLAPGGRSIAGVREVNGRLNVAVVDVATRKSTIITNFRDADVVGLVWLTPDRLAFSVIDRKRGSGDQSAGGLFVIDRDASHFKPLVERSGYTEGEKLMPPGTDFHSRIFEGGKWSDDIVVQSGSMQARGKFSSALYRLNTVTGQSRILTLGGPSDVATWVVDRAVVPRAAVSSNAGVTRVHYRDDANAPWRVIFEFGAEDTEKGVLPLAFDAAGTLYVSAGAGSDFAAIHRFDAKTSKLDPEPVLALKGYDLTGGLRFSSDGSALIGVEFDADRSRVLWLDPRAKAIQEQMDKTFPDSVNRIQADLDDPSVPVLVSSYSDRDPGRFYLFDAKQRKLEQIAATRPWIKPEAMRPTTFFRYDARDGMSIPAQLTLPEGTGKVPLVVLHYGGPWVRPIHWQWDPVVQFLASRGYAVFMPAPRASTGFGAKLFKAGWKQWGQGMQDDVTDGVQFLIKQGRIDADRVCIAGASYGGYLTMMGLVKEPQLFKCGINWVGVTDPSFMFTVSWTDFNRVDAARYSLPLLIGDLDKDAEMFRKTSPVVRAAEIKQPVLMAYGGLDQRVPIINGEKMRDALKPHNKDVEWIVYPDEGHGWLKYENNVDFWTRAEAFLAKSLAR